MKFLDAKRDRGTIENKMAPGPSSDKSGTPAKAAEGNNPPPPPPSDPERTNATPAAARIAEELGVDLSTLKGSGVDGVIIVSDVRAASEMAKSPERSESRNSDEES